MRKRLLFTAMLCVAASFANATDWVDIGTDAVTTTYVDADKIKYHNQALNQRTAWVKIKYKRADAPYKAGEYSLASQIIDCKNDRFAVKSIIAYTAGGQVKTQTTQNTGWMDIPPGSNFEYVAETICSYPYI